MVPFMSPNKYLMYTFFQQSTSAEQGNHCIKRRFSESSDVKLTNKPIIIFSETRSNDKLRESI